MSGQTRLGMVMLIGLVGLTLLAAPAAAAENQTAAGAGDGGSNLNAGLIGLGAAVAIAASGIATAWAQVNIGSAAVGAMAENEDLFGKGLILTALPETIVLFGLVIGFLLVQAIP